MGRRPSELGEKHWKALKLFEEGKLSKKQIAAEIGVSVDYLYDLCSGQTDKCGMIASLFKAEYDKIEGKRDESIKTLVKSNTEKAQIIISRTLEELKGKEKLTQEEKKLAVTINNSLAANAPSVNIKNLSYSYTQGLSPEELIYEFTRLKTIAEGSFNRQRVSGTKAGGPGTVPEADESGSGLAEDS